ncbi:radical SAM (seleno)protein TrsS [uncultured Desulfosarcina sp.]|uniref:radical SAM (seleno)protein TrsS n=1 Tax=uncultured Desulfosarcina sp. TaxID=218289 RepID=UPI0029C8B5D0|nr:radical SAM (seleno)protein TrsS [uncultured Desulfosarcina sp.]
MTPTEQTTQSLCPICLQRLEARRTIRGDQVFLEKTCPRHGRFSTRIWDGEPAFSTWQRPKIPTHPEHPGHAVERGCPFDCGLCPEHRQRSCTILLEVTDRCNLGCPVCYADSKNAGDNDPSLATIEGWFKAAARVGPGSNIQLSGGEPTLRDDLPRIVAMGREAGFEFIQINTNGLRLADDEGFVRDLADAGLASVFLQFDGTHDAVYEKLRGRPLLATKKAAIEQCGRHGIGVVLVPTLVPGVNDNDVGNLLRMATENVPVVRALHFQPVSYFGRFPHAPADVDRLTLPQLMRLIEEQSGGDFKATDFNPPGCENSLCSFSANYLVLPGGGVRAIAGGKCCSQPIPALEGARNAINYVARQWRAPGACCSPATENELAVAVDGAMDLDAFLRQARTHRLSVSAMAFQDVWNLDLERVRDCCIHVMAPDTRLIPFCLYNLTSQSGKGLYRP